MLLLVAALLIEGVSVDINRVTRAIELLNRKVLEAQLNCADCGRAVEP